MFIALDNIPAHLSKNILCSEDGKFRCMFSSKSTISLIQPIDEGISLAIKQIYHKKILEEVIVVL